MRKGLGVFLILIFLPVCAAFGAIGQAEGFLLGAENGVLLAGGPIGTAQNTNVAVVGHNQQATDPYHFVTALQSEGGVLIQGACAIGMDGLFGVGQAANVLGGQLQVVGGGPGIQDQSLDSIFGQEAVRDGGIGAALGMQGFVGLQVQLIISPHGVNRNVQYLGLGQVDKVGGGP
jgi:hypothetical protein